MPRVFLVEDDEALRCELMHILELHGFACASCENFAVAAQEALAAHPDCVVLDLHLPQSDGFAICRDIRSQSSVPILVLTCSDAEFDEVMAMTLGADDFICKPYRPAVLIARIQALLRRAGAVQEQRVLRHAGVCLDLASSVVSYGAAQTELTRNEQRILAMLMTYPGAVVSRQELMCELWESDAFVDDNTLTVNITRVRKALASIGAPDDFIATKRGMGYRAQP